MNWREQLKKLEQSKQWDDAIDFMKEIISKNPHDVDVYLFMSYLLMNLLVEEDYDRSKHDYYAALSEKYFIEGYRKFYENPEYLFFIGQIGVMSEWYFGIEFDQIEIMLEKAIEFDPDNLLYKWSDFPYDLRKSENPQKAVAYAQKILEENSPIQQQLKTKGSLGENLLLIMTNSAKRIIQQSIEMAWQEQLKKLEENKQWDDAIDFIQKEITKNSDDADMYLRILYLLMNLLAKENYNFSKHDYYAALLKKYFNISYAKFSDKYTWYLFYAGHIASIAPHYVGISYSHIQKMLQKAEEKNSDPLYKWRPYRTLEDYYPNEREAMIYFARRTLKESSCFHSKLGSLWQWLESKMIPWAKKILRDQASALFASHDKRRLYCLIDQYLKNEIDIDAFCSEYCVCYNQELNLDTLTFFEKKFFNELNQVVERFSSSEKDLKDHPDFYYSEDQLKQKIIEIKKILEHHKEK